MQDVQRIVEAVQNHAIQKDNVTKEIHHYAMDPVHAKKTMKIQKHVIPIAQDLDVVKTAQYHVINVVPHQAAQGHV